MILRLLPSDPLYAEWDWLLQRRAEAINAACQWDTRWIVELPDPERAALLATLTEAVEEAFDELTR